MRMILLLAGATSLVLSAPALAQGNGNGNGPPGGGGKGREAKAGPAGGGEVRGNAAPKAKADNQPKGRTAQQARTEPSAMPGNGQGKGPGGNAGNEDRRRDDRGAVQQVNNDFRQSSGKQQAARDGTRLLVDRTWDGKRYRYDERAYLVPTASWCPPGLARKNNGCQPPGQARKLDRYDGWSNWYPVRYRGDGYDWRYNDGYMYRTGSGGLVSALIPLIGGALSGGQMWPQQYTGYEAPAYYDRFYGYDDGYDYRIAQNAIFAVDPRSGQIDGIAGLLTGDRWNVGQRMPAGYDVYNVPPSYRDRYLDRPDAAYRYSDGYVYEVDPATRLIRTAIELLV